MKNSKNMPKRLKLLQPFLPNGQRNKEFDHVYGQEIKQRNDIKEKQVSDAQAQWQEKKEREDFARRKDHPMFR